MGNKRLDTKWGKKGGINWEIGIDIYILDTTYKVAQW